MATNNIALSTLVLIVNGVPTPIPLGGEGTAASFVPDPDYEVQDGIGGPVFSLQRVPKGTVTITLYASDPANLILRTIRNLDRGLQGAAVIGGTMTDSHGQVVGWTESKITVPAQMDLEENASTKSWTIVTGRYTMAQVAA